MARANRAQDIITKAHEAKEPPVQLKTIPILKVDFGIGVQPGDLDEQEAIDKQVESLIGMQEAKHMFAKMKKKVFLVEVCRAHDIHG